MRISRISSLLGCTDLLVETRARPGALDETTYFLQKDPFFKDQSWFFTKLKGKNVGYIGVGIDEKFNVERNVQSGWILDIGVLKPHRKGGIGTRLICARES